MASDGKDPLLGQTQLISKREITGKPRSPEEIDKSMGKPVAVSIDGRRFYTYLRTDGTGRLDIVALNGYEVTYSFRLPAIGNTPPVEKIMLLRACYGNAIAQQQRHEKLLAEARSGLLDSTAFTIVKMELLSGLSVCREQIFKTIEKREDPIVLPKASDLTDMKSSAEYLTGLLNDTIALIESHSEKRWLKGVEIPVLPTIEIVQRSSPPPALPDSKQGQATDLDRTIERIRSTDPHFPTSISKIPTFPFTDFQEMLRAIRAGTFAVAKFSFHQDLQLLSIVSPSCSTLYFMSITATYLVPIASIILAFAISHWFWIGLLYFLIGARVTTSIWKNAILSVAQHTESAFCLLFYASKISAYDFRTSTEYEWNKLTKQ